MPIYEYRCPECDFEFELLHPMAKTAEEIHCPRCKHPAKRIFSLFASVSKDNNGVSNLIAGTGSSCAGCTASSCTSCKP